MYYLITRPLLDTLNHVGGSSTVHISIQIFVQMLVLISLVSICDIHTSISVLLEDTNNPSLRLKVVVLVG